MRRCSGVRWPLSSKPATCSGKPWSSDTACGERISGPCSRYPRFLAGEFGVLLLEFLKLNDGSIPALLKGRCHPAKSGIDFLIAPLGKRCVILCPHQSHQSTFNNSAPMAASSRSLRMRRQPMVATATTPSQW